MEARQEQAAATAAEAEAALGGWNKRCERAWVQRLETGEEAPVENAGDDKESPDQFVGRPS